MNQVVFIVGPTATGKSETAYLLAKSLGAEIVSADSMLVYREPSIITAKPSAPIRNEVVHHLVGIISVEDTYSVFDYYRSATKKIKQLFYDHKPVVVCGGSGLYIKAILDGIFEGCGKDEGIRKKLTEQVKNYGSEYLYEELKQVDLAAAKRISPQDLKRIIRALEVFYLTGIPISQKQAYAYGLSGDLPIRMFGFQLRRDELYRRIEARVEAMFTAGAVDEVEALKQLNLSLTAQKIIGISEIAEFLDGKATKEQASANWKQNTRNFAKRQLTWFRNETRIEWLDIDGLTPTKIKEEILKKL